MVPTTSIITTPSNRCSEPPLAYHGDPTTLSNSPPKSSGDFASKVTVAGGVMLKASSLELSAKSSVTGTEKVNADSNEKLRDTANKPSSVAMGLHNYVGINERATATANNNVRSLSILPLIFLIFYEVSGGPFGVEDSVKAAGPLLALTGFLLFPLIWSVPEALITAEMGTMYPEDGGYVVWVSSALGPFWGFQQGWMKWLSGVIDNALYPVLFLDHLKLVIPVLADGYPWVVAVLALTIALTYMNFRGLTIVGWVAVLLGIFSLVPFIIMGFISIPKIEPTRWLVVDLHVVDWNLYLNTLFWNLNFWDSISTLAGEVDNPKKTLPKALLYALILVVSGYFFPLLTGTGAVSLHRDQWTEGYFSVVAKIIGGVWLRWWIMAGAAVSNMGLYVTEVSSDSFQLLGMAERGMIPEFFAKRSRYGTPSIGILVSASGFILLSWLSVDEIVAASKLFILLRDDIRVYHICKVMIVSVIAIIIGLVLQPSLKLVEKKKWIKFSTKAYLPDLLNAHENSESLVY
ncbi:hypothetical protein R6Q59_004182 [Mikania micrantha]